jgi:hypothetical protein
MYMQKPFEWSQKKNEWLKKHRGTCFEEVVDAINSNLLDKIDHPNQERYRGQQMYIVQIALYVYQVPFVEDEQKIFLKTVIPSRKYTKKYLQE